MSVLENLSEEECYLWAILSDPSGLDQAEFLLVDNEQPDGCFRAWPFQWPWWRDKSQRQIDQSGRSVGKSKSIAIRALAFPFINPGQEMVVTAPEGNHLDAITDVIETSLTSCRLTNEMIGGGRTGIKHRPFHVSFQNGARIMGRIPQRDGKGIKGTHPVWLEMDECFPAKTLVLTMDGYKPIEEIEVGTKVWTHKNQWKKVTKKFDRGLRDMVKISGMGHPGLVCSANHKFWVMEETETMVPSVDCNGRSSVKRVKSFIPAKMTRASDLGPGFFWSTPTRLDFRSHIPNMVGVGKSPQDIWEHQIDVASYDWAWLCGLWIAEGSAGATQCTWSVHNKEVAEVTARMTSVNLPYSVYPQLNTLCSNVTTYSPALCEYMKKNFGSLAHNKRVPIWALRLKNKSWKQGLFDGAIYGDGNTFQNGWNYTTVSKELALTMSVLATGLDYEGVGIYENDQAHLVPSQIRGRDVKRGSFYQVRISRTSNETFVHDKKRWRRIRSVEVLPEQMLCYDMEVEDDHSFVVESNICSNSQDYPDRGWTEIIETLKMGTEGSMWRAHGVTRGVRDFFYQYTQPGSGWRVHRITSMHRPPPYWSNQEREDKIQMYGSRDHPDYRRNVLGLHGDATNPLFVLHRLMRCCSVDVASDYNTYEYYKTKISNEMVLEHHDEIIPLLDIPSSHKKYARTWMGADIGFTNDPTVIVVFGEEQTKKGEEPKLKLLSKIMLDRISAPAQVETILHLMEFYNPKAFSMDSTGVGLPLFQIIQDAAKTNLRLQNRVNSIKGYNFSSKILVDFDSSVEVDEYKGDPIKDAGVFRNVLEYSSDFLRRLVDQERIMFPYDTDLLKEFNGQTYAYKSQLDMYGRRKSYSTGSFHTLDATRMAVLGFAQFAIEELTKIDKFEPVVDVFIY